ncbi:putative citrate transporter family protein [Paratrimastix pyriformis]|uniref:Citrate transporter family protein n=1 Tax=Paratrimastix pyriformis TaxID=342808 RepID=A0ABQ8US29_9EUKA|nr:putative citrate transporter family protein [Paratrimastix pyriformis]
MLDFSWLAWELPQTYKWILALPIFVVVWCGISFRHVPFIPLGRSGSTVVGACLMVLLGVIHPNKALGLINTDVILLLLGFMVMVEFLDRAGVFVLIGEYSARFFKSAFGTLIWICIAAGALAAIVTNDTTCVFFAPFVVHLCRTRKYPFAPFLLGLATSANIGSSLSPVGNPQNMIVATAESTQGGDQLSFMGFLIHIGPAAVVGMVINTGLLCLYYWKPLKAASNPAPAAPEASSSSGASMVPLEEVASADGATHESPVAPAASAQRPLPGTVDLGVATTPAPTGSFYGSTGEAAAAAAPSPAHPDISRGRDGGAVSLLRPTADRPAGGWWMTQRVMRYRIGAVLALVVAGLIAGVHMGWCAMLGAMLLLAMHRATAARSC